VHVRGEASVRSALARLRERGLPRAVIEAHVPGRTVKFYGVRGTRFFRSYAEDGSEIAPARRAWWDLAERAAESLGLTTSMAATLWSVRVSSRTWWT
jgi:hypothetical protein